MLMQQPQKDSGMENDEILENESSDQFSNYENKVKQTDEIDALDYDQLIGDPINMSQVQDST